jgi:hypothetical protein
MAAGTWQMIDVPALAELWRRTNGEEVEPPRAYRNPNGLTALVGREPLGINGSDWRWHISVRYGDPGHNGRVPSWEELVTAAHELRPGVCFVVGVPPRSWWMSVHPDVLHLHETRDEALIEQYRTNAADMNELTGARSRCATASAAGRSLPASRRRAAVRTYATTCGPPARPSWSTSASSGCPAVGPRAASSRTTTRRIGWRDDRHVRRPAHR